MNRDLARGTSRTGQSVRRLDESAAPRHGRRAIAPAIEPLEGRPLLSFFSGPSAIRPLLTRAGQFLIQVSGPGLVKVHPGRQGAIGLIAFGTTTDSTLSVTLVRPRWHATAKFLAINNLTVTSGLLGSLNAGAAELTGAMTPLNNGVSTLDLAEIGPSAQLVVNGSVAQMSVGNVDLGPSGRIVISGTLNTTDLAGPMTIGGVTIDGGQFVIGQDSLDAISVTGNLSISHDGVFSVGRDLDGGLTVNGNLVLDTGGQLMVGRNLSNLTVNGNVIVNPSGSGIVVDGALDGVTVAGIFQGQGGTTAPTFFDLGVGLNLNGLTINGGNKQQNGLINANIRAGGSITGVSIAYGSVNSTIQPNTPPPQS
jgi:hypothetical protein